MRSMQVPCPSRNQPSTLLYQGTPSQPWILILCQELYSTTGRAHENYQRQDSGSGFHQMSLTPWPRIECPICNVDRVDLTFQLLITGSAASEQYLKRKISSKTSYFAVTLH
ncbi:hypothetical protein KC19_VG324800 [Ceratodon purpureus]|uniref:Uncharacterized protein n=1 Tax=Ceratodon purpureus TaxID=3225 RepID=A0A8T0HVW4_CERPU|nr:hypothetical protein KC19_VG324800 [Ceratodon purpureus]